MIEKRVLIIEGESLIDDCIKILLGLLDQVEISRIKSASDIDLAFEIENSNPDILVFNLTDECEHDLAPLFDQLQTGHIRDRLILIRGSVDVVEIYVRQQIKLQNLNDLLRLFRPEPNIELTESMLQEIEHKN